MSATDELPLFLLPIQCLKSAEGDERSFSKNLVALWHCFMEGRTMLVAFPYIRAVTIRAGQLA